MPSTDAALVIAIALAGGVLIQGLARIAHVPAIVLLLGAGVALGPEGLGWVQPASLGEGLFLLVDFAVAVILFEGALNLDLNRLRREERVIRRLITVGAVATLAVGTLAARLWLGWSWTTSALFGSLVVVTGPTVVGPLVRNLRLRPRLQTVLEAEGVFIDPIGALLAVLMLEIALAADGFQAVAGLGDLATRLLLGIGVGAVGGLAMVLLLRFTAFVHGIENVLILALVILLFHLSDHALSQSGLLAVTVAGVIVGNMESPVDENLREFKDQLTLLFIGMIFLLLAADVQLADMRTLGWGGAAVVATLVLVGRPLTVWIATYGAGLTGRERLFLSVVAPRGIVAAAVASLVAATLDTAGIPGGTELRALVFLVIAGTVVAAGLLAWPLSRMFDLQLPARNRVAILGAQGLGLVLATELKGAGVPVVLIDADPQRCQQAERQELPVVFGDGLQERTLRRARIELVGTVVGATFNDNLNSQFVRHARQAFGVPVGLVSVGAFDGGRPPEHVARHGADVLFGGAHDQERWDVRWRQQEVSIVHCEFTPPGTEPPPAGDDAPPRVRTDHYAIITTERGGRVAPMRLGFRPKAGDRAAVALFDRAGAEAREQLEAAGWRVVDDATSSDEKVDTI